MVEYDGEPHLQEAVAGTQRLLVGRVLRKLRYLANDVALRHWWKPFRQRWLDGHAVKSYSQEGEDMVLRRVFGRQPTGFYVDVGAHHPRRFSNTCLFYRKGWHGLNIEPDAAGHALLAHERRRDVNLRIGISDEEGEMTYFRFGDPALNTFDAGLAERRQGNGLGVLQRTERVPVRRLASVLEEHLAPGQAIDFMNIDVEGLDLAVLRSNDWERFRPRYLLVESLGSSLDAADHDPVCLYARQEGYLLYAKTHQTLIFRDGRAR